MGELKSRELVTACGIMELQKPSSVTNAKNAIQIQITLPDQPTEKTMKNKTKTTVNYRTQFKSTRQWEFYSDDSTLKIARLVAAARHEFDGLKVRIIRIATTTKTRIVK